MATTIQVSERTLQLLKQLREEFQAASYDEAITKIAIARTKRKSMAGSLKAYLKGDSLDSLLKEVQHERRKSNRF